MAGELTATFGAPFPEQVAAFRLRLRSLIPTYVWDQIMHNAHDRAFVVAGATKADLLADLASSVDKAISRGTSLAEFRKDFRKIVEDHGWHGWTGEGTKRGGAWRTKVIYRTNMATSYASGRRAQLIAGGYAFWIYRHGSSMEPRIIHLGWDGLVLPPDHPFWATHSPPNGWGCSCYVLGARTLNGAVRLGGQPGKALPDGWQALDPRTGVPTGIDKGWAYAPGSTVSDDIIAAVTAKADKLPEPIQNALMAEIAARREAEDVAAMERLLDRAGASTAAIMERAALRAEPRLSLPEKAAIFYYTTNEGYRRMNRNLREIALGRGSMADPIFKLARVIDVALARLPRFEGLTYRGIHRPSGKFIQQVQSLEPGEIVAFRGFTSTSIEPTSAFRGRVRLIIHSRSGRKIEHLSWKAAEQEVLFGRGLQFRVIERRYEGERLILEVEELPKEAWTRRVKELMLASDLEHCR